MINLSLNSTQLLPSLAVKHASTCMIDLTALDRGKRLQLLMAGDIRDTGDIIHLHCGGLETCTDFGAFNVLPQPVTHLDTLWQATHANAAMRKVPLRCSCAAQTFDGDSIPNDIENYSKDRSATKLLVLHIAEFLRQCLQSS